MENQRLLSTSAHRVAFSVTPFQFVEGAPPSARKTDPAIVLLLRQGCWPKMREQTGRRISRLGWI
jgi:hypothetical protein